MKKFDRCAILALWLGLAAACAEIPEPGMRVGELEYAEGTTAALQDPERWMLADVGGFGLAVARGELDSLAAPLIEREVGGVRVAALPYHLALRQRGLSEEELRGIYAADPDPELVVRHVVRLVEPGDPPVRRAELRAVAEEVARRAAAGEDFAELAARFSEEPGAAQRGGLLQPGRRGSWVEPFWEAASNLSPGEVSGVVETPFGFHVLRLDERRSAPFEEADRARLARRAVPAAVAAAAMEEWAAAHAAILLDPPALQSARRLLAEAEGLPDTLIVATGAAGGGYTGRDLAVGWARLEPQARTVLEGADEIAFARWVEEDARAVIWAAHAETMGVEPPEQAAADAELRWMGRFARWSQAFGLRSGMTDDQLRTATVQALLSGAQEARAARDELRSLRPLLRDFYPVALPPAF